MASKLRKRITFHSCELDSTGVEGLTLRAVTDRGEITFITISYWGVGCVSRSITAGMKEYAKRAGDQLARWTQGVTG